MNSLLSSLGYSVNFDLFLAPTMRLAFKNLKYLQQILSSSRKWQPLSLSGVRSFSGKKDESDGNSYENDYIYDEEGNEKIRPGAGKAR